MIPQSGDVLTFTAVPSVLCLCVYFICERERKTGKGAGERDDFAEKRREREREGGPVTAREQSRAKLDTALHRSIWLGWGGGRGGGWGGGGG